MTICGQTLILVDNDSTVTELNQKIIKSTLKYMLYHAPENRAFSINNYGHELEEEESFSQDINDLLCKVDLMEFKSKDSNLTDVLTKVLKEWKESDFACRDIVVFTDGLEGEATEFENEELFYMIENTCYPIYIVNLVQENNPQVKKHLSAIATTSEGKLLMSEYPGDDAGVDRHLSEEIFKKMDEYESLEWKQYEEGEEDHVKKEGSDTDSTSEKTCEEGEKTHEEEQGQENTYEKIASEENVENEEYLANLGQMEGQVIYESHTGSSIWDKPEFLVLGVIILIVAIIGVFISSFMIMKRKKKDKREEKRVSDIVKRESKISSEPLEEYEDIYSESMTSDMNDDFTVGCQGSVNNGLFSYLRDDKEEAFNDRALNNYNDKALAEYDVGLSYPDDEHEDNTTRLLADDEAFTRLLMEDSTYTLELIDLDSNKKMTLSVNAPIVVGRSKSLTDYQIEDDSISKKHMQISHEDNDFYIEDLDSSNGTYLNDARISRKEVIKDSDVIRIGCHELKVKL